MYDAFTLGGFRMANAMGNQQANKLQDMADMTMGAIAKENASRVAQSREQRHMQHQMEMQKARLAHDQEIAKLTAIIERLKDNCGARN